jgi:hypothetical protein
MIINLYWYKNGAFSLNSAQPASIKQSKDTKRLSPMTVFFVFNSMKNNRYKNNLRKWLESDFRHPYI